MIGFEEKQTLADLWETAADALGRAVKSVEQLERRDYDTVRAEPDAADAVCVRGPEVIKALRSLSRRYVR